MLVFVPARNCAVVPEKVKGVVGVGSALGNQELGSVLAVAEGVLLGKGEERGDVGVRALPAPSG